MLDEEELEYIQKVQRKNWFETYREKDYDRYIRQKKEAYQRNKDKINAPMICECGKKITKSNHRTHLLTKVHRRGMILKKLMTPDEP